MDPKYNTFFSSLPHVGFQECMSYQYAPNEIPFYPPEAVDLGQQFRQPTDNFSAWYASGAKKVPGNDGHEGTESQRNVTLETIMKSARNLTDEELGKKVKCYYPNYYGRGDDAGDDE